MSPASALLLLFCGALIGLGLGFVWGSRWKKRRDPPALPSPEPLPREAPEAAETKTVVKPQPDKLPPPPRQSELAAEALTREIEARAMAERRRIAADLHDDLGAKLLTIVHTSGNDRVATLAREALEEMRLSVRGLSGRPVVLSDAMADWRSEAIQRLTQAGVDVEWPLTLEDFETRIGARTASQVTRLLREAFNNLLRHSQARRCEVVAEVVAGVVAEGMPLGGAQLRIVIQDDGTGFDPDAPRSSVRGQGLDGMRQRALDIGGSFDIRSAVGRGTRLELSAPILAEPPAGTGGLT